MDKISKALAKLSARERAAVKEVAGKILAGDFSRLDIKKLKGRHDIYRVRTGKIRIIYRAAGQDIFILAIERRNDNTYNF